MKNHAISALAKQADELSVSIKRTEGFALEYEAKARTYRSHEAEYRRALSQTEAAIEAIRAAERQIALYGRVVVK